MAASSAVASAACIALRSLRQQLAVAPLHGRAHGGRRTSLRARTSTWASRSSCRAAASASSSTPAADSSVRWSISRPAVAATLSSRRAASDTPATRTSSSERNEAGSSGPASPAARAANNSSAKYGLPSAREWTHATSSPSARIADDARDLQRRIGAGQRIEVKSLRARAALQLAYEPEQTRRDGFIRAQRDQQQQPLVVQVAREEAQQVLGGAVGPVEILDHEQDRHLGGETAEQSEQQLEQPGLRIRRRRRLRYADQLRHQPRQLPMDGPGRREPAQRRDDRRVRQLAGLHRHALSPQHLPAQRAGAAGELARQPRLADARIARHQREAWIPVCRPLQRRLKHREDVIAADHPRV